jgi:hypothetical protein
VDFSKYVDWIKLSPRYLLPLSLFTGFVIFAPHNLLVRFGLGDLLSEYRFYFGLGFLLTTTLLLTAGLTAIYEWTMQGRRQRAALKNMRERLHHLAEPEKEILRPFIYGGTRSQGLNMADGRVGGLEAEGIIFRSSNFGNIESWAYNLQPWAWNYLRAHPELLALEDPNIARALLQSEAGLPQGTELGSVEDIEEAYRRACARVERHSFRQPHTQRMLEEAKEFLIQQSGSKPTKR